MTNQDNRQLIEEEGYAASRDETELSAKRLDAILDGTYTRLCVSAEGGHRVVGDMFSVISQAFSDNTPQVAVLYRFDDEHVYLLKVELY